MQIVNRDFSGQYRDIIKQEYKNLFEVNIYEILGKLLYQEKTSQGSLALDELGKGTYIVKVKSGNEMYHKKIIIN